jgi:hypothetical protein
MSFARTERKNQGTVGSADRRTAGREGGSAEGCSAVFQSSRKDRVVREDTRVLVIVRCDCDKIASRLEEGISRLSAQRQTPNVSDRCIRVMWAHASSGASRSDTRDLGAAPNAGPRHQSADKTRVSLPDHTVARFGLGEERRLIEGLQRVGEAR